MEKFNFFNDIDGDRVYFAEDFARHLAKYFTNGIFNNELRVVANNDMSVTIEAGDANIEGYRYTNTAELQKTIDNADGTLNRIDNVVLRLDLTNRLISAQIIKGTFAENPTAPALVRSSTVYDLKLAEVTIAAGVTSITQSMIRDTRFEESVCGVVASTVQTLDTEAIYDQLYTRFEEYIAAEQTEFTAWFNRIKGQLDSDAAGHLAQNINQIVDSGLKSYTTTLEVVNWALNNETNLYEYDIIDSDITSNTLVNVNLDLNNQTKLNDGMVNSYNGGFKIATSDLPLDDIGVTVTYQVSNLELEVS